MDVSRREFLVISGVLGAGVGLSSLGLDLGPVKAYADDLKIDKMKAAKLTTSICPYLLCRVRPDCQHRQRIRKDHQH